MHVQRRPEGNSTRLSREVPDSHQMPIVSARFRNGNLVPADMKGCEIQAVCRPDFDDMVPFVRLESGDVVPGTGTVLH